VISDQIRGLKRQVAKSPRAPREEKIREIFFWVLKLVFLGGLAVKKNRSAECLEEELTCG
jgi:hypothetical protein